jgi:hypothetical protein
MKLDASHFSFAARTLSDDCIAARSKRWLEPWPDHGEPRVVQGACVSVRASALLRLASHRRSSSQVWPNALHVGIGESRTDRRSVRPHCRC